MRVKLFFRSSHSSVLMTQLQFFVEDQSPKLQFNNRSRTYFCRRYLHFFISQHIKRQNLSLITALCHLSSSYRIQTLSPFRQTALGFVMMSFVFDAASIRQRLNNSYPLGILRKSHEITHLSLYYISFVERKKKTEKLMSFAPLV